MADAEHHWVSDLSHGPEVVCESEYRPMVADGAEVSVQCVRELAVVDELCPQIRVCPDLVGRPGSLQSAP